MFPLSVRARILAHMTATAVQATPVPTLTTEDRLVYCEGGHELLLSPGPEGATLDGDLPVEHDASGAIFECGRCINRGAYESDARIAITAVGA